MAFAVISDIHGYGDALSACLVLLNNIGIKQIFCLGDIVDGGDDDAECVGILRNNNIACVRGNHDEVHHLSLCDADEAWLQALPLSIEHQGWFMVHDTPRRSINKVSDAVEAWNCFDDTTHKHILLGHAHVPAIYEYDETKGRVLDNLRTYDDNCVMRSDCRYLIAAPSLAYNRAVNRRPGFCIIDERSVVFTYLDLPPLL